MEEFLYYHKLLESNFFKDDNPLIIAEIYLLSFSKPGNNFNFSEQFLKKFSLFKCNFNYKQNNNNNNKIKTISIF